LPVLRAELAAEELVGLDRLRRFGALLYGETDPAAVLHDGNPLSIERRNGEYRLSLQLPFTDRDDLDLGRVDNELLVRVGPYRRALLLPDSLKRRTVGAAHMTGDRLEITFVEKGATA